MKNRMQFIFAALVMVIFSNSAWALSKTVTLDFDNAHIRGHNVLMLKKALKAQYPGINVRDYDLERVTLVGKSRKGKGVASLRVADWTSRNKRVGGNPQDFRYDDPWSHTETVFRNRGGNEMGPWQLNLRGNFKVSKVVLSLRDYQSVSRQWWKPMNSYGPVERHYRHRS